MNPAEHFEAHFKDYPTLEKQFGLELSALIWGAYSCWIRDCSDPKLAEYWERIYFGLINKNNA
jgi:hypothetical protein